jgi:hypothetical protein
MRYRLINLIEIKMKKIPKSSGMRNKIVIQELKSLEKTYKNIIEEAELNLDTYFASEYDYADALLYSIHAILGHYGVKEYIND